VAILAELFVDTRDATYVYNQARCFEQNGRFQQASDRFREYLRIAANLSAEDKASVQKHIADCEALLEKSQPSGLGVRPESTIPAQAPPPANAEGAPTPPTPPVGVVAESPPGEDQRAVKGARGAGLRTAGVIVAALGGAALVTAVALNLKVNSMAKDLEAPGAYSRSTESRRSDYATLTWIGYGVGGACLAGGAVLYLLGRRSARTDAVALAPVIGPDHAGAALRGAF
jgi:hypothetical protein